MLCCDVCWFYWSISSDFFSSFFSLVSQYSRDKKGSYLYLFFTYRCIYFFLLFCHKTFFFIDSLKSEMFDLWEKNFLMLSVNHKWTKANIIFNELLSQKFEFNLNYLEQVCLHIHLCLNLIIIKFSNMLLLSCYHPWWWENVNKVIASHILFFSFVIIAASQNSMFVGMQTRECYVRHFICGKR